jgi:hypothetical protein
MDRLTRAGTAAPAHNYSKLVVAAGSYGRVFVDVASAAYGCAEYLPLAPAADPGSSKL